MKNTIANIILYTTAFLFIVFGLNKFFGFIPVEPPADPKAQQFLGTMFTTYLFVVVAFAEILGGVLLLLKSTRMLGWLLLSPVVFNIVAFHIAHDFVGNGIWLLPSTLFLILGFLMKGETFQMLIFQKDEK